jgi:putative endonuclease
MSFIVYILKCSDGTLYTGWTNDLDKRLEKHNAGKGSKYVRARLPATLAYFEKVANMKEAMARERAIKKLNREEKLKLLKR